MLKKFLMAGAIVCFCSAIGFAQSKKKVLNDLVKTNAYLMRKWPDPAMKVISDKERTSNLWTRGVYYEGLMNLYRYTGDETYLQYAKDWAEGNNWSLRFGKESRHADPMCAGQTYLDLYELDPEPKKIADLKHAVDLMVYSEKSDDWNWIDALQMAMPVFAKFSIMDGKPEYSERMYEIYMYTKTQEGGGLYNTQEKLWWRDKDFVPPYKTPGGENCYWSRGNGWVVLALARVMEILPKTDPHYSEYENTFKEMMYALLPLQREDGFWNVSLTDPTHFGGPELSGTALFAYGMAWGINHGLLPEKTFKKPMKKAWKAMSTTCIHDDGMLGYVQSTGKEPKDGQPLSFAKPANFEDYGLGCFLLAGVEILKL
ncbi:glycoside hydrolase family 88/105 protein [Jiulongibacter sp. NS-SX5]|uniref:glycoside hydrolase family 88/105 protein n=1 Tax=Jiulongibacter sp. NS-SX5 TaxID=3463854 RepID=UPI004057EAE2